MHLPCLTKKINRYARYASCTLILLMTMQGALAQITQSARFEKEFKYSDNAYTIIALKTGGMMLLRDLDKTEKGKKPWEIVILDENLKETKTIVVYTETRNNLIGYEHAPDELFLLYREGDTERGDLTLVRVNLKTEQEKYFELKPELTLNITHFNKAGESIVLGGYVNKEPAVLLYDMKSESMKVLPGFFQKETELVDLRTNVNSTFNVVLIERARDQHQLSFQTYDETGQLLLEDKVNIEKNISLQTGITSTLQREDLIVMGTWGEGNSRLSNGFYAMPVDPFGDQKITYVAHGELEHLLDYQKENRAERIKEKTKEEIRNGNIPNYTNYVMPYRIEEYEGGFILLAEIYNPATNNYNNFGNNPYNPYYFGSMYSPYGGWYYPGYRRMYPRPYSYNNNTRTNDDVKTYESAVIAFNPAGKLRWDVSLDLDEIKLANMEQVADFHYFDKQVVLVYKKESELISKWVDLETNVQETNTEKIKLSQAEDEVRSEKEYEGGVRHWHGNVFYVWGFQSIKNPTLEDRVRDVFYINKVEVE